jgi:uncharacterized membrane protein (DUF4010 family)
MLILPDGLQTTLRFLTSLGIGLLLGLQRQRTPGAKAGLRTFALVALFATASAFIAEATRSPWVIPAGLLLAGLMIIAAYQHDDDASEADSGTTTVIAVLLCYALGVMAWLGETQLAVAIGIVATLLLHFKAELHGFSEKLSRHDVASILQFGVLSFIILPFLPNEGFGPYRALNPYHIWLMVVLVSGISLAGYLALRLVGARQSVGLVGVSGGLVSSTATTLVYARQGRSNAAMASLGAAIIVISNLTVLARLAVITMVVAPAAAGVLLPMVGSAFAFGLVPAVRRLRAAMRPDFAAPALSNPTDLRVALGFGAIYALVLVGSAWLSDRAGSQGLYAVAVASGPVDVDAITLSSLRLFNAGSIEAGVAAAAIALAYAAAVAFKLGVVGGVGGMPMLRLSGPALAAPVAGIAVGVMLFA